MSKTFIGAILLALLATGIMFGSCAGTIDNPDQVADNAKKARVSAKLIVKIGYRVANIVVPDRLPFIQESVAVLKTQLSVALSSETVDVEFAVASIQGFLDVLSNEFGILEDENIKLLVISIIDSGELLGVVLSKVDIPTELRIYIAAIIEGIEAGEQAYAVN